MKISKDGTFEIIYHEAIVTSPYLDEVAVPPVWTVGIGHTAMAGPPDPKTALKRGVEIDLKALINLFVIDIRRVEDRVNKALKVPVSQHEFDALVSFDYNTGGIFTCSTVRVLNQGGDRKHAGELLMLWNKPKRLIGRRSKEKILFQTGKYSNNKKALVYKADVNGHIIYKSAKTVDISALI